MDELFGPEHVFGEKAFVCNELCKMSTSKSKSDEFTTSKSYHANLFPFEKAIIII